MIMKKSTGVLLAFAASVVWIMAEAEKSCLKNDAYKGICSILNNVWITAYQNDAVNLYPDYLKYLSP